jgi:hypothetical protein
MSQQGWHQAGSALYADSAQSLCQGCGPRKLLAAVAMADSCKGALKAAAASLMVGCCGSG